MIYALLAVLACTLTYAGLVGVAIAWRCQRHPRPLIRPGISILKPMKGVDDDLEANLESFVALDYPEFELLLAAADPTDPALTVARRVAARRPELTIRVFVFPESCGPNPKVSLLVPLEAEAQYDLVMVSDSNVVVPPDFLDACVRPLADARVGMVHSPVVGVDEVSLAAAFENLQLTCFSGVLGVCTPVLTGIHAVVGKNLLMRREALHDAGGFFGIRKILADDHILAMRFVAAGWTLALADQPVKTVNRGWGWSRFVTRHIRWSIIRRQLSPAYPLELAANPTFVTLALLAFTFAWQGAVTPGLWTLAATIVFLKLAADACACRGLRGQWPWPHHLLAMPLKDLLMGCIWVIPFVSNRLVWRGTPYHVTRTGRMARPEVWRRAMALHRHGRVTAAPEVRPEAPVIVPLPTVEHDRQTRRAA